MTDYINVKSRPVRFYEGWTEHKSSQDNKWRRFWCVIKNDIVFIFSSERTSREHHVGTLLIGPNSKFEKRDGDEKSGYKFDLYTKKRLNKFRTAKFSEREVWRAIIEGITTGRVSDSIDLLPGQINHIRLLLSEFNGGKVLRGPVNPPPPVPFSSVGAAAALTEGFDSPNPSIDGSFWNDTANQYLQPVNKKDPPWYFPNCSRDLAEKILMTAHQYGNTLMRENTGGSVVISKKNESTGSFTHYKVESQAEGYKIDVENYHEPMGTLSQVMDFFVTTSGSSTTHPMTCNNLSEMGISDKVYNDYNTKIFRTNQDADSGEETVDASPSGIMQHRPSQINSRNYPHTTKVYMERNIPSAQDAFNNDEPPEPPAPPPPAHFLLKQNSQYKLKPGGQPMVADNQTNWKKRSQSVPNINPDDLEKVRQFRKAQVENQPPLHARPSKPHYVNDNPSSSKRMNEGNQSIPSPPPLPPNHPTGSIRLPHVSKDIPPPLPPNHPSSLKKSASESACSPQDNGKMKGPLAKKSHLPKHSQSMGAADTHRKMSPIQSNPSNENSVNELTSVTARINKNLIPKPAPSVAPKPTPLEMKKESQSSEESLKSPSAVPTDFKKELEAKLGGMMLQSKGGAPKPKPANETSPEADIYESIDHYQNAKEIRSAKR